MFGGLGRATPAAASVMIGRGGFSSGVNELHVADREHDVVVRGWGGTRVVAVEHGVLRRPDFQAPAALPLPFGFTAHG